MGGWSTGHLTKGLGGCGSGSRGGTGARAHSRCAWRQAERPLYQAGTLPASWECLGVHHCCLSPAHRQKLHEADLELQRKREYIEELEPPTDGSSEQCSKTRWVGET